jgi:hypothetical protein
VLWDPAVVPGQPSASRRLVPVILPGLILIALWACCQLRARALDVGARRLTSWAVGVCCVLALVVPAFWSSFAPTVSSGSAKAGVAPDSHLTFRGAAASRTGIGSLYAADSLCTAIGANASVVFIDAQTADYFAPVVRSMCDEPAATVVVGRSSPGSGADILSGSDSGSATDAESQALEQLITSIERTGRRPVLLGASESALSAFGVAPREVVSLQTRTDAAVLTGPPAGTWPLSYTVWMASPLSSSNGA